MCRLFGLHAGATAVAATFWLLDAADSLAKQSYRNPDGAGIGVFSADGTPTVDKQPLAAWRDTQFAAAAHTLRGTTFVAHVRHASIGTNVMADTHPFLQDGRLFAHNGIVQGLTQLDRRLAELDAGQLVHGDTDSERIFALITMETRRHGGEVGAGLTAAISWVSENLPIYALNLVLSTPTDLWALRYPATHELYLLQRPAGGAGTNPALDARSNTVHVRSAPLAERARSCSPVNAWMTTPAGSFWSPANCSTSTPTWASTPAGPSRPPPTTCSGWASSTRLPQPPNIPNWPATSDPGRRRLEGPCVRASTVTWTAFRQPR